MQSISTDHRSLSIRPHIYFIIPGGNKMIRLMAEYRVKEGTMGVVHSAIKEFVAAIWAAEAETEYLPYQVGGSDRFIHIMAFLDEDARQRHQDADYTARFVEVLYPNYSQRPEFTPLEIVE
jgi:quinol monooxygenase YgiN